MKRLALIALLLILVGCAKEVSREYGTPYEQVRSLGCTTTGFCFTCMPGFSGKMDCGVKLSPYCPGTREVRVRATPVKVHYDDNTVSLREDVVELEEIQACR